MSRQRRILLTLLLCLAASVVFVPGAMGGNFDEARMGCVGESPGVCPAGTEGQPYTLPIYLQGDEDLGCAVFSVSSGGLPPGLTLNDDGRRIEGTPTQAGTYDFYLTVTYNRHEACPFKNPSDDSFRISVNPGVPRLVIGPEQSGVPAGTVGVAYSLAMTANLSDPKTWSIAGGTLPPGTGINATTGVISGTPTTAGTYVFTVLAVIGPQQSDTKTLAITVRDPVTLSVVVDPEDARATGEAPVSEVGVPLTFALTATGGTGTYTWAIAGRLPRGVAFETTGELAGRPLQAGSFRFEISARDTEGRVASYSGVLVVSPRLAITTRRLRPTRVDRIFMAKLSTRGGIAPVEWKLVRGKLPRGVWLDWSSGTLLGIPVDAGRFRFRVQAIDALGVTSTRNYLLRVAPALRAGR